MNESSKFSIKNRLKSFSYAFHGIKVLLKTEHNTWIYILITIVVIILGFILNITKYEWLFVIFAIGLVFALEGVNSAIERLADYVSPEKQEKIKIIKDLSASSVLIAAITAFIIGLLIFIPYLVHCF